MIKKIKHFVTISALLLLGQPICVYSQKQPTAPMDFNIDQAVSVIISQKGFDAIKDDIITILNTNGVDLSRFAIDESEYKSEKIPTEKLAANPSMQKTIKESKELLEKYLTDFELKDHQFKVNIKKILLQANWKSIQLNVHPFSQGTVSEAKQTELFRADLILTAENIRFSADSLHVTDLENAWLGTWGLNQLVLETQKGTIPLRIKVATRFFRKPDDALGIEILKVETNIDKLKLDLHDKMKVVMPKIEIKIDDKSFEVDKTQIEKDLKAQEENILKSLQEAIDKNVQELVPTLINKYLSSIDTKSVSEISQMAPPSAPTQTPVDPLVWGIKLSNFTADNGLFAMHFKGLVEDPTQLQLVQKIKEKTPKSKKHPYYKKSSLDSFMSQGSLSKFFADNDLYDLTFSFKTDFFNEFIIASYNRGYIKTMPLGEDDSITMIQSPYLYVDSQGSLKMHLKFTNVVKGFQKIAVKNPVVIEMDLFIAAPIDPVTKKFTLIVKDFDMDSVQVSEDNFNFLFKDLGVRKTREKIENSRKTTKGMVLSSELPVPSDLLGVSIVPQHASFDKNGYMLFHMNYR